MYVTSRPPWWLLLTTLGACNADGGKYLQVLEEGLTNVPPEDTCLTEPAVMCCDDLLVMKTSSAAEQFSASENDLSGAGRDVDINFLEETGIVAFTSSCPGDNAALNLLALRIDDLGVATLTYDITTDAGDGESDPVRPFSVARIDLPPSEISDIRFEVTLEPDS